MEKMCNVVLAVAVIVPVVLLLWPFAMWNDAMSLILRVIPSLSAQVLLYRIGKRNIIQAIPAVLTGALASWGMYLYCTSPHWRHATLGGLLCDYVSPFLCCVVAWSVCLLAGKKK